MDAEQEKAEKRKTCKHSWFEPDKYNMYCFKCGEHLVFVDRFGRGWESTHSAAYKWRQRRSTMEAG